MKKFTFSFKSLLLAAGLLLGSANASGAALTTMTGIVGPTDNSGGFGANSSKVITIAAGEFYVYTFVNYNKGGEGTNVYENWTVEGRRSDNSHCFDFRADGGYWTWKPDLDEAVLSPSYSGNVSTDVSATPTEWLSAYNGVTVTLTVTRSNDGNTITVAHSATTNNSINYAGTFTCTGFGTGDATILITNEASHQIINKVVYTYDGGGSVYVAPEHTAGAQWGSNTGVSTVDANLEHYNNDASSGWAGCAYAKFSYPELPNGVSITAATINYCVKQGGSKGRDDIIYYMNKDFDLDWANFAGQTGTDLRNSGYRAGAAVATAPTGGTGDRLNLSQTVTSSVSAIYGQNQKYILFQWTGNAGGADLYGKTSEHIPSLEITYTTASAYNVTFTETNSVAATVKIDDTDVTAGTILVDGNYSFTATAVGYETYNGNFTVSGADKNVEFTMTAKTRYTFTVNAVDAGSNVLKTIYTDADSYEGKSHTIVYPKYLTGTGNIVTYSKDNDTYGENKTAQAQNETYTVSYTAYDGVAYFVEVEDVVSATAYGSWNCSNGGAVRGFTTAKNIFTVPATGVYDITYAACNNNVNYDLAVTLSKNETEIATKSDLKSVSINQIKTNGIVSNNNISFVSGDVLKLTPSSTNGILDYMLIELKSVPATIGATGYTTFASSYALDLTNLPDGLTAYYASAIGGENVTLTPKSDAAVAAGTGLVLKGAEGNYNIPVAASGAAIAGNKLVGCPTASSAYGEDCYVLWNDGGVAKFCNLDNYTVGEPMTIPAGKAYLDANAVGVKVLNIIYSDETATGVDTPVVAEAEEDGVLYNTSGQQVTSDYKGIVIKNGKKYFNK